MQTEHDKFVEQVAASYAHEIKNPIAIIKAHLQLLELDDHDPLHQKSFRVAHRELERINKLVYDLMNSFKPQCSAFDSLLIDEPLHEMIEIYEPVFAAKGILFTTALETASRIRADRPKLMQVLINLFNNAIEAVQDKNGEKKISLACFTCDPFVTIEISDNGSGINRENLSKIGQAFFSTKPSGNGLGLFFSQKIIHEHSGTLTLTNNTNPDEGLTCAIRLPKQL